MPLRLTITSYHKLTPGQCSEKVLDQGQLTIGRGPDNDWVLPDPERLVSSRHCTILNRDGVYYLTDTSTNGVLLVNAGHRLRRGNSEPLQDGETVRLGEYDILVQLGHDIALPGSGNPQTDPFTSFDALMSRQAAGSAPAFAEPAPTPHPAVTAGGDLLQAFLRGAGMTQLKVDPAGAEAQMEAIGRSYRGLVEGLVDVLRARASLKGEFRMAQTMIQPVQNNPLKFAPNVDEAMLLLLRRDNQAFMAPDRAVADSFEDLKAHQLAVMAGVQAAIRHLLARFEPAALEARFGKPAGLSGLLPGARQAQNWDSFTELYAKILREAEDDFQELFGREFSRAYEEHSARLRRS
ncbi:signal peptide protein [Pseudomonas aeruginosa VRFPA09]|nr:signal peptide protein [Pseudomonas aeruginosa VRFPA09]